jgi:hypothetical protein
VAYGVHVFQVTKHLLFLVCAKKKSPALRWAKSSVQTGGTPVQVIISDDNQVSSHHPSFTDVMAKGRV